MRTSAPGPTISLLLVADDLPSARRITAALRSGNFSVTTHLGTAGAAEAIVRRQPDAVILAMSVPVAPLLVVCREIRLGYVNPLLILADGLGEEDELAGLRAGADDFLPKSVHPRALVERIRARLVRLRRLRESPDRVELPQITIDAGRRAARVNCRWIDLTTAEFEVLWLLARHAGRTVRRGEICSRLRGFSYNGLDRTIDLRVARLRRKLGDDGRHPSLIKSVRGEGYMLVREA